MRSDKNVYLLRVAALLVLLPVLAWAAQQVSSLVINGQSGHANVVQVQGRNYVEVDGLTRITNGSISFNGNQIVLTIPGLNGGAAPEATPDQGLSKGFLNAAIETMSQAREWHAALKTAIERSYPISEDWIGPYRRQVQQSLRMTEVAASTDADKNTFTLVANEVRNMNKLSDRYLQMVKNMNYIAPDSLSNDPLEQKLIACGHSLVAIASSGQFTDDGSCQ